MVCLKNCNPNCVAVFAQKFAGPQRRFVLFQSLLKNPIPLSGKFFIYEIFVGANAEGIAKSLARTVGAGKLL